jgi:hypothetical protein
LAETQYFDTEETPAHFYIRHLYIILPNNKFLNKQRLLIFEKLIGFMPSEGESEARIFKMSVPFRENHLKLKLHLCMVAFLIEAFLSSAAELSAS